MFDSALFSLLLFILVFFEVSRTSKVQTSFCSLSQDLLMMRYVCVCVRVCDLCVCVTVCHSAAHLHKVH